MFGWGQLSCLWSMLLLVLWKQAWQPHYLCDLKNPGDEKFFVSWIFHDAPGGARNQVHVHASVRKNQQEQILENFHYRNALLFVIIGCFQSWRNMEPRKNLLIDFEICLSFWVACSILLFIAWASGSMIVFWTTQLYQNQLVSCYFYASYYWIFKVHRHLFKCEVWVT